MKRFDYFIIILFIVLLLLSVQSSFNNSPKKYYLCLDGFGDFIVNDKIIWNRELQKINDLDCLEVNITPKTIFFVREANAENLIVLDEKNSILKKYNTPYQKANYKCEIKRKNEIMCNPFLIFEE